MKAIIVSAALIVAGYSSLATARTPALVNQQAPHVEPIQSDPFLMVDTYRLWAGRADGAGSENPDEVPTISVMHPQPRYANGTAVIVAPGGAYMALASSLEGRQIGDWFASRGVTAFVLKYRFAPSALPIPLLDGTRAVRFVRANAGRFGIDPGRIGMIGFSAGGHLTAMTAARADKGNPASPDPIEKVSSRPDFIVLGYPWLEGTAVDSKGESQYCSFTKLADCKPEAYEQFIPLRFVTAEMPPAFIFHTTADSLVPVEGSLRFYQALHDRKVPVELHVFSDGEHGTGLGGSDAALARWPELLENWLRNLGMFSKK